ncbi:hypothetical protein [Cereibacter ovatus]|uniref:hypothetical protein n=1 Tax=Cereibacter ovatus TaxID=439529 RepID=UPI00114255C4|nr:hypothetical protein [Cereibacter ovatus]
MQLPPCGHPSCGILWRFLKKSFGEGDRAGVIQRKDLRLVARHAEGNRAIASMDAIDPRSAASGRLSQGTARPPNGIIAAIRVESGSRVVCDIQIMRPSDPPRPDF